MMFIRALCEGRDGKQEWGSGLGGVASYNDPKRDTRWNARGKFLSRGGSGGLVLLLGLANGGGEEGLDLVVGDLLCGLEVVLVGPGGGRGEADGALGVDGDGEEDLGGDGLLVRVLEHVEGGEEAVLPALLDADPRATHVLEALEVEGEGGGLLLDLGEHLSGGLELEQVGVVGLAVDGSLAVIRAGLAVGRGGDRDVDTVDLVLLELDRVGPRAGLGVEDDLLLCVDLVLGKLVGLHALDGLALELLDGSLDLLAHLGGSLDGIGSTTLDRVGSIGTNHEGLGADGGETVDVGTELHLDDIALLERDLVLVGGEGRVVAHDVVERERGGECNALSDALALVDGRGLVLEHLVTDGAELEHGLALGSGGNDGLDGLGRDLTRDLVLGEDGVVEALLLLCGRSGSGLLCSRRHDGDGCDAVGLGKGCGVKMDMRERCGVTKSQELCPLSTSAFFSFHTLHARQLEEFATSLQLDLLSHSGKPHSASIVSCWSTRLKRRLNYMSAQLSIYNGRSLVRAQYGAFLFAPFWHEHVKGSSWWCTLLAKRERDNEYAIPLDTRRMRDGLEAEVGDEDADGGLHLEVAHGAADAAVCAGDEGDHGKGAVVLFGEVEPSLWLELVGISTPYLGVHVDGTVRDGKQRALGDVDAVDVRCLACAAHRARDGRRDAHRLVDHRIQALASSLSGLLTESAS
ncbi:hypothetical protein L1887_55231 [Cichorium endivia]|nr:hypothetical protein L1887_55231 [Cichorium endivia]